ALEGRAQLAFAVLSDGDHEVIERVLGARAAVLDDDVPAAVLLLAGDDRVLEPYVELERGDGGRPVRADLLPCRVGVGPKRPGEVREVIVEVEVLEPYARIGQRPDSAHL